MRRRKKLLDNKGMTLVEVAAAFVILLMGMSSLIHATTLSLKIINKSREVQVEADAAVDYYYRYSAGSETGAGEDATIKLVPEDGTAAGELKLKLYTYESPATEELEGGRYLYYFRSGGDE